MRGGIKMLGFFRPRYPSYPRDPRDEWPFIVMW